MYRMPPHVSSALALAAAMLVPGQAMASDHTDNTSAEAQDDDFIILGAGALLYRSPFRGEENNVLPIPIVAIKQDVFYVDSLEAGVELATNNDAPVALSAQGFVAARAVAGSTRNKITADAGARISIESNLGTLSLDYRHDITDEFDGGEFTLRYSKEFAFGRFTLEPAAQANFLDRKTANHVYGVTPELSEKFARDGIDIAPYTVGKSATNFGGDITATYQLSDRLILIGNLSTTYLGKPIHSNPGFKDEFEGQAVIGLGYVF